MPVYAPPDAVPAAGDERAVEPCADDVPDGRTRAPRVRVRELGRDDADACAEARGWYARAGEGEELKVGVAALGVRLWVVACHDGQERRFTRSYRGGVASFKRGCRRNVCVGENTYRLRLGGANVALRGWSN